MGEVVARRRLSEIVGGSPERIVPPEILMRGVELLAGGQVGYRIDKYANVGLTYGYSEVGKATNIAWLKDYAEYLSHATAGGIELILFLFLTGKWSRILTFGALFGELTYIVDKIEAEAKKAMGLTS